jgi:hypothetical protein
MSAAPRVSGVTTDREAFLAGERPEDVHIYLDEARVSNIEALEAHGERADGGIALVLDGTEARGIFEQATGIDPMALAQAASGTEGDVDADCAGGSCPACGSDPDLVFSFVEEQNAEAGGLYAEGAVVHAYAACGCGERYSQKWVAGER